MAKTKESDFEKPAPVLDEEDRNAQAEMDCERESPEILHRRTSHNRGVEASRRERPRQRLRQLRQVVWTLRASGTKVGANRQFRLFGCSP